MARLTHGHRACPPRPHSTATPPAQPWRALTLSVLTPPHLRVPSTSHRDVPSTSHRAAGPLCVATPLLSPLVLPPPSRSPLTSRACRGALHPTPALLPPTFAASPCLQSRQHSSNGGPTMDPRDMCPTVPPFPSGPRPRTAPVVVANAGEVLPPDFFLSLRSLHQLDLHASGEISLDPQSISAAAP